MNILNSGGNDWKAIDPEGVVGVRCLEVGRFVQNHLGDIEKPPFQ